MIAEAAEMLSITIYVMEHEGKYYNILTLARNRQGISAYGWKSYSPRKKTKRFDAAFVRFEGEQVLAQITKGGSFVLMLETDSVLVEYDSLIERASVFIPNESRKSIANGWWPGTLTEGFTMKQWYGREEMEIGLHQHTLNDMREHLGMRLEMLQDYLHSVLWINSVESYKPWVLFNPDNDQVVFQLRGEVPLIEHRVIVLLGEGEEAIVKLMVDLPEGQMHFHQKAPFDPTRLGYELYVRSEEGWQLVASKEATLIRDITFSVGLITGKLKVIQGESDETYDIVSREKPVVVTDQEETRKQPWLHAEAKRNQKNHGVVLEELGSLFVKFDGPRSQKNIWNIIKSNIYEPEENYLHLWDPYLDGSILNELMVHALRKPNLEIKLLLSENPKANVNAKEAGLRLESPDENSEAKEAIRIERFPNCKSLVDQFEQFGHKIANLKGRNWYRSGDHVFHDRFLITSRGVWQLGSSLKDLGNYHTTIYRLEGKLPSQVREEFLRAWEGDFHPMYPSGFELFPKLQTILVNKKEGPQ